jgi:small conductance mechanosensitive channel
MSDKIAIDFEKIQELVVLYGMKLIFFVLGVIATIVVSKWLASLTRKALRKGGIDESLQAFIGKMVKWAVLAAGLVSCLGIFGIETASFAAILAAVGFTVGMALQGTLSNFASGVMLLIFKPFVPGDVVQIAGDTGVVAGVDIFNTMIDTFDNRRIIVPNSNVFGKTIENISFHATRRVSVSVGSAYDADMDQTRKVLLDTAKQTPHILNDPEPAVVLDGLGDSSINWSVRVWTKKEDFWPVRDQLTRDVKYALDEAGIGIPFPQRDIHLIKENSEQE